MNVDAIRQHLGPLADKPHVAAALAHIGQPGSRDHIPTPAAVLDLDAFDAAMPLQAKRELMLEGTIVLTKG